MWERSIYKIKAVNKMKNRKKINFLIADDLILVHCDDLEYSRKIVLEALILVMDSQTHELAQ